MRNETPNVMEGIELPLEDKIRTLEEKETYKYLGILEANNIKHLYAHFK